MISGYSKRNRKARRTSRRTKRGFGSLPAEHVARAVKSAKDTRHLLKLARRELARADLRRSDCARAFDHLLVAARAKGHAEAEGIHTGLIRQTKRIVKLRGFGGDKPFASAVRRFHAKCMIDPRGW